MKNDRLSRDRVADLLHLAEVGRYPLDEKLAGELCSAEDPTGPCTLVYGLDDEDGNLVSIMTATYSITFPHEDGYRMVRPVRTPLSSRGGAGGGVSPHIYGCNVTTSMFYEETPFHPERLLANLVQILHPELGIQAEKAYFCSYE